MNNLSWLSASTMNSLGWALLHFLWQGTALAALAAAAMAVSRRASVRYMIGVGALVLMLLAPLATFAFYSEQNSGGAEAVMSSPLVAVTWPTARDRAVTGGPAASSPARPQGRPAMSAIPWLVEAWLLGVAFFSLRTAGGFLLLERERRKRSFTASPRILEICYTLQDLLGLKRAIEYCECAWLQAPAVIGWFRPMVLLPVNALTGLSEEQLQMVIAHELAHIRRFDLFVNVFQVCVETLLFYHPAVWWLNKKVRAERENCCDDVAIEICGNALEYARALALMEEWRSAPVLAMAANRGPLTERIVRVLGLKTLGAGMRGLGISGSLLCLTAALVAGNALIGMAHPRPQAAFFAHAAASVQSNASPSASTKPSAARAQSSASAGASASASASSSASSHASASSSSYIDGMNSVGLTNLNVDTLIALKIQDVTPDYVRGLQAEGLHPNAEKLIALRVQGVTPEYVREMRQAGLNPDVDRLIALKVQDVDGTYYRGLKDAGLDPDVDHLIAMKVQDVTPEYVRELKAAGLTLNVDQVISFKVQDVSPAYLKSMHDQGIDPHTDELISMKVQDVTPEYVQAIHALGLKPSVQELIAMRVQDVTPEYIKALQSAGYSFGVSDLIRARVQDVTPEFIEQAKKHGFKDLTLQKLIQLREYGILDSKADL